MSRFFHSRFAELTPYTPGEQPQNKTYVKLNTNESPFPPSPAALAYAAEHTRGLNLYPDPDSRILTERVAALCGVEPEEVILTNGSDEILNFAFLAFCEQGAAFPDITYGFYPVFAALHGVDVQEIPLDENFRVNPMDYGHIGRTIFLANPNAPTGLLLSVGEIERIIAENPDNLVVIDEAYIDFGGDSCIPLVRHYENLLVTQTFSKSRSMAGARLGFGVGNKALIQDLHTIRNSTNPYNINSMTTALAMGTLEDPDYTWGNCAAIMATRGYTAAQLLHRGFAVMKSSANFLFVRTPAIDGETLYQALKEQGILVRHFHQARIRDFVRVTIGTREQMDAFLQAVDTILEEKT